PVLRFFCFQAEDGIRDRNVTGVQTCALPISVKCRLIFSMGTTWAYPPPVAPPFIPNTGPSDGSRRATMVLDPTRFSASAIPTETVDLPSPAGVGETAVTSTSLPR